MSEQNGTAVTDVPAQVATPAVGKPLFDGQKPAAPRPKSPAPKPRVVTPAPSPKSPAKPGPVGKAKAPVKAAKGGKGDGGLSDVRTKVLKLVKAKGMTLTQLEDKLGVNRRAAYHAVWNLRADGFLKEEVAEGVRGKVFVATAKGLKAVTSAA